MGKPDRAEKCSLVFGVGQTQSVGMWGTDGSLVFQIFTLCPLWCFQWSAHTFFTQHARLWTLSHTVKGCRHLKTSLVCVALWFSHRIRSFKIRQVGATSQERSALSWRPAGARRSRQSNNTEAHHRLGHAWLCHAPEATPKLFEAKG